MSYTCKYAWSGVTFGTFFIFLAWVAELSIAGLTPTLHNIIQIHLDNPVIFIVDMASPVLGVSFHYIGKIHQRLYSQSTMLQVSLARFKAAMDTSFDAIIVIDERGKVLEFNTAAEAIFGYKHQEVVGKDLADLIIPHRYREAHNHGLKVFLETGEGAIIGRRIEIEGLHRDGHEFPVEVAIGKAKDSSVPVVVGFIRDITERKATQNEEKDKRADELALANKELAFQNKEKSKRTDELAVANKELVSQKELMQFIDTANAPIFGIDAQGKINEWNLRSEEITGFSKTEVMGHDLVANFITDDYKVSVGEVLTSALKGDETANYEFPLFTKSGDRVDVLLNSTTRRDITGKIVGVVGVGQDITELNKVLVEQESIAKELTQFIDTANAPIFGIDAQGKINEWNLQSEKITGFSKTEVMGRDLVANFIADDYKVSVGEVLASTLKGDQTANYEFPLFTKSGERVDVLLNSTTRRDAGGAIVGVVGVGQDITELNRIRKEQESVANDLTQLIDTANAPIFGIDAAGLVNEWNQRAELLTGFDKADVMGKDLVAGFITDDYKVSVKAVLDKALKGEESANYEFPLFTKSGERVDVLLNSTTRRDAGGTIVGVVGVGQDITELKFTQAQVIQSSKLATLGEMATSVAHELNQPLNVIRMAAANSRRKISKGTADLEYLNDKLERIEGQTVRAAAIIDHMRMFGRKAEEKPGSIDPRQVVTNALDLMGEQLRLAGIEIVTEFPEDCSSVSGHTIQLEQVILNLLTNGRDAMAERDGKTKITLRVFEDENGVHVTSQDTGGGIPEEVLPRIFEPFYTTKAMGKGTGLGLSVSYGIIREMNGTITAESIEDGARFTITLPATT
jgi:PAS domain S-box-containing protein